MVPVIFKGPSCNEGSPTPRELRIPVDWPIVAAPLIVALPAIVVLPLIVAVPSIYVFPFQSTVKLSAFVLGSVIES
jgi:hypothetical protein